MGQRRGPGWQHRGCTFDVPHFCMGLACNRAAAAHIRAVLALIGSSANRYTSTATSTYACRAVDSSTQWHGTDRSRRGRRGHPRGRRLDTANETTPCTNGAALEGQPCSGCVVRRCCSRRRILVQVVGQVAQQRPSPHGSRLRQPGQRGGHQPTSPAGSTA